MIAFNTTLKFRATLGGQPLFELTVGQGIELAPHSGVTNAMAVILPTPVQGSMVPHSNGAFYEIVEGTPESIIMRGPLIGQGD
jgi:hypothetical protein